MRNVSVSEEEGVCETLVSVRRRACAKRKCQ